MGIVTSSWLETWREAFEEDRRLGLAPRRKTFEDVVKDIKLQEGWGMKNKVTKKPVDISLELLSIKDAICEKPIEDDSTEENTLSISEIDMNSLNTVQVYQSKDTKGRKSPPLRKASSFEPIKNGFGTLLINEKVSSSEENTKKTLNISMIAFRNLVDSKERLRNKLDSMRKIKQWDSPMTCMSMRFL